MCFQQTHKSSSLLSHKSLWIRRFQDARKEFLRVFPRHSWLFGFKFRFAQLCVEDIKHANTATKKFVAANREGPAFRKHTIRDGNIR